MSAPVACLGQGEERLRLRLFAIELLVAANVFLSKPTRSVRMIDRWVRERVYGLLFCIDFSLLILLKLN